MIKGIGIDIIEIDRIKSAAQKYGAHFLNRIFTPKELNYCKNRNKLRYPELAVRFAAKEAYSKAIGTGINGFGRKNKGLGWKEVEVVNDPKGKPLIAIKGRISKKTQLSLSHSRYYAVASVYVEN